MYRHVSSSSHSPLPLLPRASHRFFPYLPRRTRLVSRTSFIYTTNMRNSSRRYGHIRHYYICQAHASVFSAVATPYKKFVLQYGTVVRVSVTRAVCLCLQDLSLPCGAVHIIVNHVAYSAGLQVGHSVLTNFDCTDNVALLRRQTDTVHQ